MPEDFLLRNVNGQDVWVSEGETDSVEIKAQSHVRIKIANVQLQPEKLVRHGPAYISGRCYVTMLLLTCVEGTEALALAAMCSTLLRHSNMPTPCSLLTVVVCIESDACRFTCR